MTLAKKLSPVHGKGIDVQKQLAKLGELYMRTPRRKKKYNYCGPGTKLEERLASSNPKIRDPINNLDAICVEHDKAYGRAKSLKEKHKEDDEKLEAILRIPWGKKPWGTAAVQGIIKGKRKLGLGNIKGIWGLTGLKSLQKSFINQSGKLSQREELFPTELMKFGSRSY